jgi:excisionase family DNA binding protein
MSEVTTKEAAERLGVTVTRVQQLIHAGRLPAEKKGRDYFIKEEDLKLVEDRKPGRPRKAPSAEITKHAAGKISRRK